MPSRSSRLDRLGQKRAALDATARGVGWIDGRLLVRVAVRLLDDSGRHTAAGSDLAPELVLTESSTGRRITLPSSSHVRLAADSGQAGDRELQVEVWLDPRTADDGGWIPPGRWSFEVQVSAGRRSPRARVADARAARAAMIAGRPFVARADASGDLQLDASGDLGAILAASTPRLGEATFETPHVPSGSTTALVPLDGVRVHGRGTAVGTLTLESEADVSAGAVGPHAARREARTASLIASGEEVILRVDSDAQPGERGSSPGSPPRVTVVACESGDASLQETLGSVLDQSLPLEEYEVVIVPAGSGAASDDLLRSFEAAHPNVRVTDVPAPGASPGVVGLREARGDHVLFIDAGDRMSRHALERLADAADATGADVVMGRVLAVHHRVKTPKPYEATLIDADPVRDRLLDAVTPNHLFRRAHLVDHVLGPADPPQAQDGGFPVAEAVLAAQRVVTLSDIVYCERLGAGATAVSATVADDDVTAALRLAEAIVRRVPEGERRDALLRFAADPLAEAVLHATTLPPDGRTRLVERMRDGFTWWSPGVRAQLDERTALVLDVLHLDEVDALADILAGTGDDPPTLKGRVTPEGIVYALPPAAEAALPVKTRRVSAREIRHMMTSLSVRHGVAHITGWIGAPDLLPAPDGVRVTLRLRGGKEVIELPATLEGPIVSEQPTAATPLSFRIDPALLSGRGRWDLEVAPVWSGHALPAARFGSKRPSSIDEPSVDATNRAIGSPTVILYGTANQENLSIARHRLPRARTLRATGLALDADGRPEIVLAVREPTSRLQVHAEVDPAGPREARHRLPWRRLDRRRVAVRLPVPAAGSVRCEISAVHRGMITPVRVRGSLTPVSSGPITARGADGRIIVSRDEGAAA